MNLAEVHNKTISKLSFFDDTLLAFSLLIGVMVFITSIIYLKRYADNPKGNVSMAKTLIYMMTAILIIFIPQVSKNMGKSMFTDELISSNYATTSVKSKPYIEPTFIKKTSSTTPYEAITEKSIDYNQFIILFLSILGVKLGFILSVCVLIRLRRKLRLRKYQKIVSKIIELNNDFVTLSSHIGTIESCLNDIKTYRVVAPIKTKSLLDGMLNILEHKKQMFNKSVKEIHEMQPDLKFLGGSI